MQAEELLQRCRRGKPVEAEDADLHRVVGDQGDKRGRHAPGLAEALADVGVERTRVSHMPAHRGVADREDEQDDRDDDVHERDTEQLSDRKAGGHAAGYDGQRCGRGDHEEHDVRDAE